LKIFSGAQIKEWDKFTIEHEPISSIDLMERAAAACCGWLQRFSAESFIIFCGTGNNGGDGLAIGRMLLQKGCRVAIYHVTQASEASEDFKTNLARLHGKAVVHPIIDSSSFPPIVHNDVIIDALFGTGLNKPSEGLVGELIDHINRAAANVISIDIPSGLFADKSSISPDLRIVSHIVKATFTLTFQQYKLSFLMQENHGYFGKIVLLDIGLHKDFYHQAKATCETIDFDLVKNIYREREPYAHKGNFGYACLLAGSYGMMGAAVLAARSCLRSGVGKLTCIVCEKGYSIMQTSVAEAMAKVSGGRYIKELPVLENFNSVGAGPGIGIHSSHKALLHELFAGYKKPVVLDADALNMISRHKKLLSLIPPDSILTPHPAEFERLFGVSKKNHATVHMNDFRRSDLAREQAKTLKIFIVVKGHHTMIACPDGQVYFNFTGNAGMATAGSGDVLTGILTGLLAQGYSPFHTCLLGVYIHGLAGDIAANKFSQEAMIASDITACLGDAFKTMSKSGRN